MDENFEEDLLMSIIESEEDEITLKSINPLEKMDIYQIHYMEDKHWYFKYKNEVLIGLAKKYIKGDSPDILDVGVGTGTISKELDTLGNCVHVDSSDEIIAFNKKVNPDLNILKAELPWNMTILKDMKFDYIVIYNLLEYVDKDRWTIDVLKSKLKPNGKIIVSTLSNATILGTNDSVYGVLRRYNIDDFKEMLFTESLKISFITYFENQPLTKKISESTDKVLREDDIYFNYISKDNNITYDYYHDKELKTVLKKKLTAGNQIFMIIEPMNEKDKEEYLEALKKRNEASFIDKIIDKIVDKKEKKEELELSADEIEEEVKEMFEKKSEE